MNNKIMDWTNNVDVITVASYTVIPNGMGPCIRVELSLPPFRRGVYYRAFQKYAVNPLSDEDWLNGANRLQAKEFNGLSGLLSLADGGLMLTIELLDGRYMTILPLVGQTTVAWFSMEDHQLSVMLGSLGTSVNALSGELPVLSYSIAESIYTTSYEAWKYGLSHPLVGHTAKLRSEKSYPPMFRYIGWCSWEELFFTINEQKIMEVIDQIDASTVPIQYLLIDDGHQHHDRNNELDEIDLNTTMFAGMQQSRLVSFDTNKRFPNGWLPIVNRFKLSSMNWIGLWLNFNGYWGGIHPDHELKMDESFIVLQDADHQYLLPGNDYYDSYRFYNEYIATQREAGFDFLKIDHQAANLLKYRRGGGDNPVMSAANNAKAMEAASAHHMDTHINCMAHNAIAIFNTRNSSVTRCSEDYKKGDLLWAKRHVHNSFANMPVLGHTVWGDHDMFHSEDPTAAEVMSISKAMSGGPVYLSDAPERFNRDVIQPLIYADGELLRPLAPAVPLPDSILEDPVTSTLAYGVIAPVMNRTAAITLFNLTEPTIPVCRSISVHDYKWAGAMLQPQERWEIPNEGIVLYDWNNRDAELMTQSIEFTLTQFDYHLLLMCPVQYGWAVIGRVDKYLSTAAVVIDYADTHELVISIREPGSFIIWDQSETLSCTLGTISRYKENLWLLIVDAAHGNQTTTIYRDGWKRGNI